MAVKVEFEGYINFVREFDWGTVYLVRHRQVIKNAAQEWETAGHDTFDVSVEKGKPLLEKNTKVLVKGTMKTKHFVRKTGEPGIALQVRAESVEPLQKPQTPMEQVWPDVKQIPDENAPF